MARVHYRKRFFKGLFIALRIMTSYKIVRIAGAFRSAGWKESYLKRLHRKNASLIREKALEMKGVMIKVGQFLSSRVDFLPDEYIEELSQLQDQVPPHEYAAIRVQIVESLGSAPENIFSVFDEVPIAAASLGQVHRAILKDGREAAVKVQYPGIEKVIETDIKMFEVLIRIMRGRMGWINLRVLHEEFSRIVRSELDYGQEGRNAERFRENFRGDDRVIIPRVYWEFTRGKVLTLEFVGGIKITECEAVKASGLDCRKVVNLLAEAYAKMIFLHGFFHSDPHPGNIFVREGPQLVFVDFGMVQAISPSTKRELRRYAGAIVQNDTAGIVESLERMGFLIEGADYKAIENVTQSLIDKYRYITPEELKSLTVDDIGNEIDNILAIIHNFQVPNYFILLGRTIGMLNGTAYSLNPDVNIIEIGKPYIKEFFRGTREEQFSQALSGIRKRVLDFFNFPSQGHDFLKKASRGELSFKIAKAEMQEVSDQLRSLTDVMLLVILTVTTAVSSVFFSLIGSKLLPLISSATSIFLGILSVYRLLRR